MGVLAGQDAHRDSRATICGDDNIEGMNLYFAMNFFSQAVMEAHRVKHCPHLQDKFVIGLLFLLVNKINIANCFAAFQELLYSFTQFTVPAFKQQVSIDDPQASGTGTNARLGVMYSGGHYQSLNWFRWVGFSEHISLNFPPARARRAYGLDWRDFLYEFRLIDEVIHLGFREYPWRQSSTSISPCT
jgi:hypothetical protein